MPTINGQYIEYPEEHCLVKPATPQKWNGAWQCKCGFKLGRRNWTFTQRFHEHLLEMVSEQ